ncbi:MAG: type II toxin-antitoxin system Phd/YefM family antitoxin [Burkholderiales bacterium]
MERWALREARNRLSEVVRKAREHGPQMITLHGRDAVVIVDASEYQKIKKSPRGTLAEFFQRSPLSGVQLGETRGDGRVEL